MLYEIKCDEFKSYGKPRPVIRFNEHLNTVLGGKAADNSVGKSTFMLIIDYAFGGDTYRTSDAARHIGNHVIMFAFKFGNEIYYFSRDIVNGTDVNICDENYNITETISINDFRKKLFELYDIGLPYVTFRDVVGRYLRIYGKDNYSIKKPLESFSGEKAEVSIVALEKLFNVYWKVEQYRTALKLKDERKKAYQKARKLEFVPYSTTTKTQYKKNEKELAQLEEELATLVAKTDRDLSAEELSHADEASEIKGRITALKRQRSRLKSQLEVVNVSIKGGFVQTSADLAELSEFFPGINIQKISEIESFHGKMQRILNSELNDEANRLNVIISSLDTEIRSLEEEQRLLGIPSTMPKTFLDNYTILTHRIDDLKAQNEAFNHTKGFAAEVISAKADLTTAQDAELRNVEAAINAEMVRLNDVIYAGTRKAPVIDLADGSKYSFWTPDDSGTGTSYKSLIVFDMSILKLTPLPALAHDSLIFNHIGYAPLEKLIQLYMKSGKQIFIAFDKQEAPTEKIQKILDSTMVIQLNANGNELFGKNWGEVK